MAGDGGAPHPPWREEGDDLAAAQTALAGFFLALPQPLKAATSGSANGGKGTR
jgi:hypothetical protein